MRQFHFNSTHFLHGVASGLITLSLVGIGLIFYPMVRAEIGYYVWAQIQSWTETETPSLSSVPMSEPTPTPVVNPTQVKLTSVVPALTVEPINTTNSILIEKINVNVPIVWDVSVTDKDQYLAALNSGVAHARGTQLPANQRGNTYLFAHSTLNPWEIEKYAASFTLLHRLEENDLIVVFRDGVRFDYLVKTKEVINGFNTAPLTNQPEYPMLTLQTCDPPGIPLNRLIVTAKLISTYNLTNHQATR